MFLAVSDGGVECGEMKGRTKHLKEDDDAPVEEHNNTEYLEGGKVHTCS